MFGCITKLFYWDVDSGVYNREQGGRVKPAVSKIPAGTRGFRSNNMVSAGTQPDSLLILPNQISYRLADFVCAPSRTHFTIQHLVNVGALNINAIFVGSYLLK
jgi:hypothetical protein